MKKKLLLGAHISVSGGYYKAIERALSIGCTTLQIFTKSNRQWGSKEITEQEAQSFKETVLHSGIGPVVAHASYLINLSSLNEEVRKKSREALMQELMRCDQLGIPYLVFHPGSNSQLSRTDGLKLIVEGINDVFEKIQDSTCMPLLETMAGQGGALCSTFEDLAFIRAHIKHPQRVGICVDTCHLFAAGYDLRTRESYESVWQQFDATIGLKHLKVIHANDSKKELGSRVDRHEHIGAGCLGDSSFKLLFNDERFFSIPKILETPKADLAEDLKNMQHILTLLSEKNRHNLIIEVKENYV